jgi:prepilin-type N-terminal cleavage/methylation domain-containing protein
MSRRAGVTLIEMLVVLVLIALVVSVSVPPSDVVEGPRVDAAAAEVRQAIRFAQSAALRTGAWYTVSIDAATQVLRVYQLNAQYVEDTSVTVMHPVDLAPYRVTFGGTGRLRATIVSAAFTSKSGNTTSNFVLFGPDGMPAAAVDKNGKTNVLRDNGVVTLGYGKTVRQVTIDAVTGRVTF